MVLNPSAITVVFALDANIRPSYAVLTRCSAYPSNEGKANVCLTRSILYLLMAFSEPLRRKGTDDARRWLCPGEQHRARSWCPAREVREDRLPEGFQRETLRRRRWKAGAQALTR